MDVAPGVRRVAAITGLDSPESVLYDPEQDVYFIASMVGFGSVKFGAAYLSRADAGDPTRIEPFAVAGRGEMRLDAPKGMALQGDTLWVADIALLRALDRRTGAPLATVGLAGHGVVLLNDLALGSDGALYTTDSGLEMSPEGVIYHPGTSKVLAMRSDGSVSRMPGTPTSGHLNGLVLDEAGRHRIAVTFDAFQSSVLARPPAGGGVTGMARGSGRFDGVEILPDGRIVVTAWNDSTLAVVRDSAFVSLVAHLSQPADLGIDTRRNRVAIPLVMVNRVEFWEEGPP